jgi:predicted permease
LRGVGATSALTLEGTTLPLLERPIADVRSVNPEFFRTWGIPLKAGRLFDVTDDNRPVAVVSEFTGRHAWPGEDPIGQRLRFGASPTGPLFEVVGIVGDVRGISLDREPSFAVYVPYWQRDSLFVSFAIKTAVEPAALATAVRAAIHELDPDMPVAAVRTMEDVVSESTTERRFQRNLVLIFAAAAMLLAGLGVYGTMSYAVTLRTNEIGIRLALGAHPGTVRRAVVKDALRLVAAGLAAGIPAALFATSALRALLFGVSPADPTTLVAVCALFACAGWLAAWVPARRASRVDPIQALRFE